MKKLLEKYKEWRLELRRKMAQGYADLIINRLETSNSQWEFDYWMNQGVVLNARMVGLHDIYLD